MHIIKSRKQQKAAIYQYILHLGDTGIDQL